MLRILLPFVVLSSAGCWNNKEQLAEAAAFEKRACDCKDPACEDAVVKDVKVWFDKYKDRRGTQADVDEIERRFMAMGQCMVKVGMSEESAKLLIKIGEEAEKL